MSSFKSIAFTFLTFLSLEGFAGQPAKGAPVSDAQYSAAILNVALYVMQDCYMVQHKKGAQLSECMADVFIKEAPNPQHYQMYINGDTPGNLNLLLFNQAGYTVNCSITVDKKIEVNSCVSYQNQPLSSEQEMSITPPAQK
ncbi:hypothetical protein [Legionella shakespearei]|uniref:Uncharacterized protein n=2 Tax=Legionella shakespearei TaxID=45075 RepID=A0A0W0YL87_9GAMM|nr:hypothetical protein [Legionella shakespearei]KTD57692.1 hypothetical protein Lsha_2533 [Legionella shakespearei DSM 23087]